MLWLSVFMPELSLQSHCRGAMAHLPDMPLVIRDGIASRPHVHAVNARAREAGITPAMPVAAAEARVSDLVVVPRDIGKEHEALLHITHWLTQFSPMTCSESAGASVEVSTTLKLFGGISAIAQRVRAGIAQLGYHITLGIAPTPLAARLLAEASHYNAGVRMCRDVALIPARLADIPLPLFGWPHEILSHMSTLGLTRVRDVLSLPRAGLLRRFGDVVTHDLDRALARVPDPRVPVQPPEVFCRAMDLLFELSDVERILMPVSMLLHELQGFLRARGVAVTELSLTLKHNRSKTSDHHFASRHAIRNADDWMRLIRERLTSNPIPDAVNALKLSAKELVPFEATSESWLPTPDGRHEHWQTLLTRLGSRLGPQRVFSIAVRDDHRPERAWQEPAALRKKIPLPAGTQKPRPLLLLAEPQALTTASGTPQHHGALELLAGPERIEAGWWDGQPVARDYFVARNPAQEVCWIFCDYRQEKRWYLQGYFA